MLEGKALRDFHAYLEEEFGYSDTWKIMIVLQHRFLSQYLECENEGGIIRMMGSKKETKLHHYQKEIMAMGKFYNENDIETT